jgi:tetratricopeptide (TPR) repeat protein
MPALDSGLIYPMAIRHYARGMAFIGLKDVKNAKMELALLQSAAKQDTLKSMMIWGINSMYTIVDIAQHVLEAKILTEQKQYDRSISLLEAAVDIEDQLNYNEPPDWFFSVRHELGGLLLDSGKPDEAVKVFEEDLINFPKNGWALNGLKNAYELLNQKDKAAETDARFQEAWAHANVQLRGSLVK